MEEAQPLDSLAGGVFVGRQREMGELKACLEDALSGRGRLATLVGEPGIGKTRTAQELATYAGLRSAQVLWGRCYEEQGMPPYWPGVQAIRSYVREHEPDQLRSEMGAGAADIAEVVSDVKERLPDLRSPPQLDGPEQARFRLFDSVTSFLKSASQKQPLVLVLDDLHWADQLSLLLLQFVARELGKSRLLLVGTYRDVELNRQHPLAESLGELTRERLFQRVLLRGLSQQDVGRFIEVAAGVDPPPGLTEAVHTQTEGNPLFVTEVVRLLVQEGELSSETGNRDSWTVRIPEGVREVIGRMLNRLSQRCNETLTVASVIGREFELRQLVPLVEDISEDRLLEVLEEALASRVIEELPQTVGRYQTAPVQPNIEILLDRSTAMGEPFEDGVKMEAAVRAIKEKVLNQQVADIDNLALRQYGGPCEGANTRLLVDFDQNNQDKVRKALGGIEAGGETTVTRGILAAIEDFSGSGRFESTINSVIVIAGGGDSCEPDLAARRISQQIQDQGIILRFIGIGIPLDQQEKLRQTISAIGGQAFYVTTQLELEDLLSTVLVELQEARQRFVRGGVPSQTLAPTTSPTTTPGPVPRFTPTPAPPATPVSPAPARSGDGAASGPVPTPAVKEPAGNKLESQLKGTFTTATTMDFGQTLSASIVAVAETDPYSFQAEAGDVVRVSEQGEMEPQVELFDAQGNRLGSVWEYRDAFLDQRLESGGTFFLLVSDFQGGETGEYGVSLRRLNNLVGVTALGFGETLTGSIDSLSAMNAYSFQAEAGDVVRVSEQGEMEPQVELFDAQGNRLGSVWEYRDAFLDQRLESGGTFFLLVSDFQGGETGEYGVSLRRLNNLVGVTALGFGETLTGSIDSLSAMNAYSFQAEAGDVVRVRVSEQGEMEPQVELFDAQGNRLGSVWEYRDAFLDQRLESGGTSFCW